MADEGTMRKRVAAQEAVRYGWMSNPNPVSAHRAMRTVHATMKDYDPVLAGEFSEIMARDFMTASTFPEEERPAYYA